jgi:hypothetical protein
MLQEAHIHVFCRGDENVVELNELNQRVSFKYSVEEADFRVGERSHA